MRGKTIWLFVVGLAAPACVGDGAGEPEISTETMAVTRLAYQVVDVSTVPPGLDFWAPGGLTDDGDVYGQGTDCDDDFQVCTVPLVKRTRDGHYSVVHPDFQVVEVDDKGNVGGCTIDDRASFAGHAGVVRANGALQVLPPALPGERRACVLKFADDRVMAVNSFDQVENVTTYVLDKGVVTPLPFPANIWDINERGQATGIKGTPDGGRAYVFDADTATTTILAPVEGDQFSSGQAINKHGEVLGYSFVDGGIERIGVWNQAGEFAVWFETTPESATTSNSLAWNEAGLIVTAYSAGDPSTYLIPSPGTRLNLADLVGGAEVPPNLFVLAVNRGGDIFAIAQDGRGLVFVRD